MLASSLHCLQESTLCSTPQHNTTFGGGVELWRGSWCGHVLQCMHEPVESNSAKSKYPWMLSCVACFQDRLWICFQHGQGENPCTLFGSPASASSHTCILRESMSTAPCIYTKCMDSADHWRYLWSCNWNVWTKLIVECCCNALPLCFTLSSQVENQRS